ncbi:unnamed protein product [Brassica napus]|uniref:(rape) hypothetical protein n=1 Tax=Brassica napus TaxID=3708 RepID=A0A816SL88_BRANA|nr:unnamed protein product [Brassica napus]
MQLNNDRAQERYPVVSSLALSLHEHALKKTVKLTLKGKNPVTSRSSKLEWGNNIRYYILLDSLNLVSLLVENTPRGKAIGRCRGRGRDKRGRWISFLLHIAFVWLLLLSPLGQKLRSVT